MRGSRPGPEGAGLDPVQELEAARRRLYSREGAGAEQVAEFARLTGAVPRGAPEEEPAAAVLGAGRAHDSRSADARAGETGGAGSEAADAVRPTSASVRRRRRRFLQLAGAVLAVALMVVAIVATRPPPVADVAVPPLSGETILGFGRSADPSTDARSITYQPQGYTVFQPRGRIVAVALRCIGTGLVRISAGARFDFRCTDRERTVALRDTAGRDQPFVIMGRTVGDVVWSARVVLLDPPQTAGALPSFEDACDSCRSIRVR